MKAFRFLALAAALLAAGPVFAVPLSADPVAAGNGVRIVVPARNIARGDILTEADLSYETVAAVRASGGVVTAMKQLEGKQARRFLRAGEPVLSGDVRAPILVTKGSTVTMNFVAPGIVLTAIGKAMSEGGLGETVTILNPASYRQITATVTGAGTVTAGDLSTTIAATPVPAELAAR